MRTKKILVKNRYLEPDSAPNFGTWFPPDPVRITKFPTEYPVLLTLIMMEANDVMSELVRCRSWNSAPTRFFHEGGWWWNVPLCWEPAVSHCVDS